jgi:hypothetical protein
MLPTCGELVQALIDGLSTSMTAKGIAAAKPEPLSKHRPSLAEKHRNPAKSDAFEALCNRRQTGLTTTTTTRRTLLAKALAPMDVVRTEAAE